jgi:hypothetical protein
MLTIRDGFKHEHSSLLKHLNPMGIAANILATQPVSFFF